jgi:hypothetical protein
MQWGRALCRQLNMTAPTCDHLVWLPRACMMMSFVCSCRKKIQTSPARLAPLCAGSPPAPLDPIQYPIQSNTEIAKRGIFSLQNEEFFKKISKIPRFVIKSYIKKKFGRNSLWWA